MKIPSKAIKTVKEMQSAIRKQGVILSDKEVFKKLIEYNMFDEYGNVTQFALENGLVQEVENKGGMRNEH